MTWFGKLYLWATVRLYNELAWAYDPVSWLVSLGRWSEWRLFALNHVTGQRVLELGFGTGELLSEMAERGLDPVGLDASIAMHRVAARKLARRGLDVVRAQGLAQAIPFPDEGFDSAVSTFPAGYILDSATLEEVARVLRRPDRSAGQAGGRLVVAGLVTIVQVPVWRKLLQFLFGGQDGDMLERFTSLAQAAGLRVTVMEQGSGRVQVPVVIAERCER
jgi:ubiquinone/menaquinone biosynthesis C-methylase UbiE